MSLLEGTPATGTRVVEPLQGTGTIVVGGGCAGLALAVAAAEGRPDAAVTVLDARRDGSDPRTWCYWDVGAALLPEAVSASWTRWEIRTTAGSAVGEDPDHPYRMVRARDYRAAARRRLARSGGVRLQEGVRVEQPLRAGGSAARVIDARGAGAAEPLRPGRVRLQQRFLGQWIRTARPVFDPSTATLMDFPAQERGSGVRFVYVLPVSATSALVEATVFATGAHDRPPSREQIQEYVRERWGLADDEWAVEEEEAGSIPMTDQPVGASHAAFGMRAGIARPSTGYAFTRIQLAARDAAIALVDGGPLPVLRDPWRLRALDGVFLRFLRDQPHRAPEAFLRMFAGLPGPLTVRFLTERSTPIDELRLILALPKAPFLRAAATAIAERLAALLPRR
ncbi:lycopene cyclase family protein [Amnibacterium soli]|uniref:Lycopene cyclase family protein n=1 Tax=Amnibacterium soli TaxID=1282736 RepID=A0ABP8ZFT2_9MICO